MAPRKPATASGRKPTTKSAAKKELTQGLVAEFDRQKELDAYREMLLIRRFEEKAGQLYGMGFIGGFCHLYIGQEAVVVGVQMALKDGDQVSPLPTSIARTAISRSPISVTALPTRARSTKASIWRSSGSCR